MKTTAALREEHGRKFKCVDKFVAVVTDRKNRILKTYQSPKGNGMWKHTMNSPV